MKDRKRRAFALIVSLWILIILLGIGISFSQIARIEGMAARNSLDSIRALYFARAGVMRTFALLQENPDLPDQLLMAKSGLAPSGAEELDPEEIEENYFRDVPLGEGKYEISYYSLNENAQVYGLADEEARININSTTEAILRNLPGLTDELVDCIFDWMDPDDLIKLNGAEDEYYQALPRPYRTKNGPLDTPEELLLVKGVSPTLFWGEDVNENNALDSFEDDGDENFPPDNEDGVLDYGLKRYITTFSRGRVNLNTAPLPVLIALAEGDSVLAETILIYREDEGGYIRNLGGLSSLLGEHFSRINKNATLRSQIFRIRSQGRLNKSELRRTVEAVFRLRGKNIDLLYWREY